MIPTWLSTRGGANPPSPYVPEAVALFNRMTNQPDNTRKALINDTIVSLIGAGLWDKLDAFYGIAAHDSQAGRLNWKGTSFSLVPVNSPVFTTDRGYMGDGSSSYLNTQWVPSSSSVALTNSTALGGYLNAGTAAGSASLPTLMGSYTSAVGLTRLIPRTGDNDLRAAVSSSTSTIVGGITSRLGWTAASRTDNTNLSFYKDGALLGSPANSTSGRPTNSLFLLAANEGTATAAFCPNRIASAFMGAGLTEAEMEDLYDITLNYLTSIGAN